jgi:hypothetical protein
MIVTKAEYNWMNKLSEKKKLFLDHQILRSAKAFHEGVQPKLCNFCDNEAIELKRQILGETFVCKKHLKVGMAVGASGGYYLDSTKPKKGKGTIDKPYLEFNYIDFIHRNQ